METPNPNDLPDPNGPPVAREPTGDMWRMAGSLSIKIVVGGIATFAVLAVTATSTSGALRSHRVQWQERQREIPAAQQEASDFTASDEIAPESSNSAEIQ